MTALKPWFSIVQPHTDIQEGHLDESIFAANLAEVASGTGREIYTNPEVFFRKTYFTAALKNMAKRVVHGLNGGVDAENRVISLQTGFGGGKTHTLISLYHLAKWGKKAIDSDSTRELLQHTGAPTFDTTHIAVFTNTTNDPAQGRKVSGLTIQTLWGELAYQLGGKEAYEIIKLNDEKRVAPKGLFKHVLEQCKPALILIDELADYCVSASGVKVEASNLSDQTVSFMQELTEAVAGTDQCVLIATLPASPQELASSPMSSQILSALESRITRVGANMKPVEDEEIFEVVRRRLFEDLGNEKEIEQVISAYTLMYQTMPSEIPDYASKTEYKERLRKSYPFHPELIDMFRLRWASNPDFQRTRGVLRILASIIADLWKRQMSLTGSQFLIHTSDVMLTNVEAITSQITILNGASWDAVINADISGTSSNAFRIDNKNKGLGAYNVTQGTAATILLGTFGSKGHNKGVGIDEIKLCMAKPQSFSHNDINSALDKMESDAHYLYFNSTKPKRYWFETTPNINILINQSKGSIASDDIFTEIQRRISDKAQYVDKRYKIVVNPLGDIPEQKQTTLIILSPEYVASPSEVSAKTKSFIEKLATKKGNSDRIYRNTMLFLVCSDMTNGKLQDDVRNFLACKKINAEYHSQLEPEQKSDIKRRIDEANKQADSSLVSAYSIVLKFTVKHGIGMLVLRQFNDTLESQINNNVISALKEEEWLLDSVGLGTLRNNNLLPTIEQPVKVSDIYEAFLRFDDKPMITGTNGITQSIVKYCFNGEYCIAAGDGTNFTRYFLRETVPFFDVTDPNFWLIDKSLKPQPQPSGGGVPEPQSSGGGSGRVSEPQAGGGAPEPQPVGGGMPEPQPGGSIKTFQSITISGKVPTELWTNLLNYFIAPFTANGNKVDIEVKLNVKFVGANTVSENMPQYKSAKESAKQLGLNFEEEQK